MSAPTGAFDRFQEAMRRLPRPAALRLRALPDLGLGAARWNDLVEAASLRFLA